MTAVTGVRAHQTMLDVTGNNIANVNTTGFKKDYTIFQDLLYQTTKGASGPSDNRGGINPAQVGLGVQVGAIETVHSQGFTQYTGNKSDMMITGNGYFVFRDGNSRIYSRAGNFYIGPENDYNLTMSGTGYLVQGYKMERDPLDPLNFVKSSELTDVRIPIGSKMEARATTVVGYRCNLDSRSEAYMPIGYADIPYTSANNKAQIKLNGEIYDVGFETNLASANGEDYFSITLGSGSTMQTINFDMVGIANGMPVLSGTTNTITLQGQTINVAYDNDTGVFRLTNSGGSTLWETNLQSNMSYGSFGFSQTLPDQTAYNFIAEFDESALSGSPTTLTLWYDDGSGTMQKATATVSFKADGTFDNVSNIQGLPAGYTNDNFKIVVASDGSALEIQAAKDLVTLPPKLETVGQLTQGGYHRTKVTVYDCQGNPYTLEVHYKKLTENRWRWEAFFPGNEQLAPTPASGEITFGDCGKIVDPPYVNIDVPFSLVGTQNQTIKLDFSGESFGLDVMEGVTQYASETTTKARYQDGYTMGILNDYSVNQDGTIVGIYSNDQTQPIYRLALAQFANPMGLEKIGNTMFRETVNSGMALIDAAMVDGSGYITNNNLEMSNVDLTEEFTRLIISQRGFQANTRVVTTSDQILEEVVNMKR